MRALKRLSGVLRHGIPKTRASEGIKGPIARAFDDTMTSVDLAALVAGETERRGSNRFNQRFCRAIEARFELDTRPEFHAHLRHCCMLGLACFVFFSFDMFFVPAMQVSEIVQCGIAGPAICALAWGVGRLESRRLLNWLACSIIVATAALSAVIPPDMDPQLIGAYALANIGFIVFANVTLRLDLDQAIIASFAGLSSILALSIDLVTGQLVLVMVTAVWVSGLTLIANYQLVDKDRRAYLVSLGERLRTDTLATDNLSLREMSTSDALTHAMNRRGFDTALAAAFGENPRFGSEIGLIMIDLDYFKRFNDHYGHLAGDDCLCSVVAAMRLALRGDQDLLARYGGEEFVVLLPDCGIDEALDIGKALCRSVQALAISHEARKDGPAMVTISCGAAAAAPGADISGADMGGAELVSAADRALYRAKQSGRNQCLAPLTDRGPLPFVADPVEVHRPGAIGTAPPPRSSQIAQAGLAALVAREVRRRGRSLLDQRFGPELERRFEADTRPEFQRHVRRWALLGLAFFVLYTFACAVIPNMLTDQLMIQDGFFVPLVIAFVAAAGRIRSRRLAHTLACGVIVAAMSLSAFAAPPFDPRLIGVNALMNLIFIVFANVTIRLDFDHSVVAALSGTVAMTAMVISPAISAQEFVLVITTAIGVSGLTLAANHRLIENERRSYLASLQEHLANEMLAADHTSLLEIVTSDPLTGAANRGSFNRAVVSAFEANQTVPVALLMIDLDHFKRFNDLYGHPAGDACLRSVVAAVRLHLRDELDTLARYGGEEFAVLLPGCSIDQALAIGQRLCQSVERLRIPHQARDDGFSVVTISCGAAAITPGNGLDGIQLVAKADRALYQAKRDGRSRCLPEDAGSFGLYGPNTRAGQLSQDFASGLPAR